MAILEFAAQVKALAKKNLVLLVTRHWISTLIQAVIAPILILSLTLNIKNFNPTPKKYGFGEPTRIRSIKDNIPDSQRLVFIRPEYVGSDVDTVIKTITDPLSSSQVRIVESERSADLNCPITWRGVSHCYAIVTFHDSPLTSGRNHTWNYTMRFDPARNGYKFNVHKETNDQQRYWLPTQLAIENAISNSTELPLAYQFTIDTQELIDSNKRIDYGNDVITIYVIVFALSILPSIYHVVSVITGERESGISQLIDAMGGSPATRVLSHVVSFSIIYFPSWLIMGCLYWRLLLRESNAAIPIFWQIFSGLAILNATIFAASFFSRRRVSSIFVCVCFGCLAGGAAILINRDVKDGTVIATSLLFPAMNYIFSLSHMAIFALGLVPVDMNTTHIVYIKDAQKWRLHVQTYFVALWIYWVLLVVQILVYPVLAILAERWIHGLNFKNRTMSATTADNSAAIQTTGLGKVYRPSWYKRLLSFGRHKEFTALNGVDLVAQKNQILCLLGVNGAGKSTTLDLLSGFQTPTAGQMIINAGHAQLGICPQKNVLFERMTVLEHVKFWSAMKGGKEDTKALHDLIEACDLTMKTNRWASTLSGGQKRKLQLACMFAGDTTVCLMDEVTSGLDPISRRTIWNIILAERAKRSLVFTTHFLDEGEVLADHIVILSKGQIKCQGTGTELKNQFGGGYRVHLPRTADVAGIDAPRTIHQDRVVYRTPDSRSAAALVAQLEAAGCSEVQITGPTVEDVFLRVAEDDVSSEDAMDSSAEDKVIAGGELSSGKPTSFFQQVRVLLMKRFKILPRYWAGAFLTLALPIACMPPINDFISKDFKRPNCGNNELEKYHTIVQIWGGWYEGYQPYGPGIPFGPASVNSTLFDVMETYPIGVDTFNTTIYDDYFQIVDGDYNAFRQAVLDLPPYYVQGGVWAGVEGDSKQPPTIAMLAGESLSPHLGVSTLYTSVKSQIKTVVNFEQTFAGELTGSKAGESFVYILYAAFILTVYPAFFALYPAFEKASKVRALQYSNGVKALPLWTSYFLFDLLFVLAVSVAYTATISQQFPFWWGASYMFPVVLFHGIVGILIAYIVSNKASSQLSAFLWTLLINALSFLVMALATILPSEVSDPLSVQRNADIVAYTLNLFFPIGNVFRGMAVGLNFLRLACRDDGSRISPGSWWGYAFPIVYLLVQIVMFAALLIWLDSDLSFSLIFGRFMRKSNKGPTEDEDAPALTGLAAGVEKEASRVAQSHQDLLRMVHVSKSFNGTPAVSDVSLGMGEGEILALLGPNGAGKTTIVNMIRGELRQDQGQIYLGDIDVLRHPRLAQRAIGVCPQFDALDLLTAKQHLEFYARIKGIDDVASNVQTIMARVGLTPFADRLASKLSGGNKRKLSLAIALMGNPNVLILDEPSSSMDAAAKRRMWKILEEIAPGRSLLLTTHSMEEADHLATKAAILSQRLLAIGTTQKLREEFSNLYNVQLVLGSAPYSSGEEMGRVEEWVRREFVDVRFEGPSLGGQVKFMVPALGGVGSAGGGGDGERKEEEVKKKSVGYFIELLERNREVLGLQDYSVGAPTLERVFLSVVKDNYVDEDEERERRDGGVKRGLLKRIFGRG